MTTRCFNGTGWMKFGLACSLYIALVCASWAQVNPLAPSGAMDALNAGPVGPNGQPALDRARQLQAQTGGGMPLMTPAPTGAPGAVGIIGAVQTMIGPTIRVITGTRVYDALTGQLLDDASKMDVPESEKANYFDDGTHGDLIPGDGEFTRVDEKSSFIGPANQRVKEQLVQALIEAESLDPIKFFGYNVLSTDHGGGTSERNRAWTVVKDPKGKGRMIVEAPAAQPVIVPKYRDKLAERDDKVKNDWSIRFLQEYRKNKDNISSDFYTLYVPMPPPMPSVLPPPAKDWVPFSDPGALNKPKTGPGMPGAAGMMGQQRGSMPGASGMMGPSRGSMPGAAGNQPYYNSNNMRR